MPDLRLAPAPLRDGGGPFPAPDSVCPGCGSLERHRAFWLYARDPDDPNFTAVYVGVRREAGTPPPPS